MKQIRKNGALVIFFFFFVIINEIVWQRRDLNSFRQTDSLCAGTRLPRTVVAKLSH